MFGGLFRVLGLIYGSIRVNSYIFIFRLHSVLETLSPFYLLPPLPIAAVVVCRELPGVAAEGRGIKLVAGRVRI